MKLLKIRIPRKVIEEARAFATQVFERRGGNPDKFTQGDELQADIKGFEVEFAHAFAYKQPFPVLTQGRNVDKGFDTEMAVDMKQKRRIGNPIRFDIKASKDFLINAKQWKDSIAEAYLFESTKFVNWDQDIIFLEIHGWIRSALVPHSSEIKHFDNGSTAYQVDRKYLQNPRELYSLYQPTEEVEK